MYKGKKVNNVGFITRKDSLPVYSDTKRADNLLPRSIKAHELLPVGTQRAYFELKYFKIVEKRDAKYSLKMAAEKLRQIFPFLNTFYS